MPAQLTGMKGLFLRGLLAQRRRAKSSLPVPHSPSIRTQQSLLATLSVSLTAFRRVSEEPTISGMPTSGLAVKPMVQTLPTAWDCSHWAIVWRVRARYSIGFESQANKLVRNHYLISPMATAVHPIYRKVTREFVSNLLSLPPYVSKTMQILCEKDVTNRFNQVLIVQNP